MGNFSCFAYRHHPAARPLLSSVSVSLSFHNFFYLFVLSFLDLFWDLIAFYGLWPAGPRQDGT